MQKLLSLAIAGFALVATSQPTDARSRGRAVQPSRDRTTLSPSQASRSVQPTRSSANVERRAVDRRVIGSRARTQPSVAYGGQRWIRSEPTLADEHIDARRQRGDWALDRPRDRISNRDRNWERSERRPPVSTWRHWNRGRVYSWNNDRWRWNGESWVIVEAPSGVYTYDVPYTTMSGATVAAVQRELAREGYNPGLIDGVLGNQTRRAIRAFQRNNRLVASGRIDSALLDRLDLP